MKALTITFILFIVCKTIFSQAPSSFNYQAVIRDSDGNPIVSEDVTVLISIRKNQVQGEMVFSELHNTSTNQLGSINLVIGSIETGLADIDWEAGNFFIEISIDGTIMGASQLLSVPYALHATTSADSFSGDYNELENTPDLSNFIEIDDAQGGDMIVFHPDEGWKRIELGFEGQVLKIVDGMPQWTYPPDYGFGTVTDIDGNTYQTVIIGEQEWMAENLRVTRDANGNDITRYCYDNIAENCDLYGGIYTWYTVMNVEKNSKVDAGRVQGICPVGWHVPIDEEWEELIDYLIENNEDTETSNVGNKLKSCRQVDSPLGGNCDTEEHPRWDAHTEHYGTNDFNFSALPGGWRGSGGDYTAIGFGGYWWTQTSYAPYNAWAQLIMHNSGESNKVGLTKTIGLGLRCVKD